MNRKATLARTVPASRMAKRLPMPVFETVVGLMNDVMAPPVMRVTTRDGVSHKTPAIALEWTAMQETLACRDMDAMLFGSNNA